MYKIEEPEFKGYDKKAVDFFRGIKNNNNKPWFEAHKADYIKYCLKPTWDLVHDLSAGVRDIDAQLQTDPKRIISRIYRDIRFSKDKSPYKSRLWFTFKRPGDMWQDAPGYYFEISHDSYGFGMGMYDPSKETMQSFKADITEDPEKFMKAISFLNKKNNIFAAGGESYKRPPKEHVDEKIMKWYMMKNIFFYFESPINKRLFSNELSGFVYEGYRTLAPLYKYFWRIKEK
jgi:uncharacterized protein (TIGR02453 family)